MKIQHSGPQLITMLLVIFLSILINTGCDGKCMKSADLTMPEFINGSIKVADEFNYTVVSGVDYPLGTSVIITNTINEFYSVVRKNPFTNMPIVFYWNINSPPPFFVGAPPPNNPLQIGETVYIHKCVFNNKFDPDCFFQKASESKTQMTVVVKVENGVVVDSQTQQETTPELAPGEYKVLNFPVKVNALGMYEIQFNVNADHSVPESDTTNNIYVVRPTDNLGAGGK